MLHLIHWTNFRNREQIHATNTTSRVTHGDSRSCRFESSWL